MSIPLAAVQWPLDEIYPGPNHRPLVEQKVRQLIDSMRHDGQFNSITVLPSGEIVDGLHRYEAAKRLGWKYLVVRVRS